MLWSALLLPTPDDTALPTDAALQTLALWALQFTPRVAVADEAVVMELAASVRLFGGWRALRERVVSEGTELGVNQVAWAPNSLAALALARAGVQDGFRQPLGVLLDALPMDTLSAVRPHRLTLAHIGCRTLGDVRRLPRGGVGRRFDKQLLAALDRAYGRAPEVHRWIALPERFAQRLELMFRVDDATALLFGARRLLLALCGWLAARHSGTTAFTLHWAHDAMRAKSAGDGGSLTVRTAEPTRNLEHLCRLLAEHLARVELLAPVGDLELVADEVMPLEEKSASWLPDDNAGGETLPLVLERIAARLGPQRVVRPVLCEDHRPEWMCRWQPAPEPLPRKPATGSELPQPGFILSAPLKLLVRANRPYYQGELQLLAGPQRVEGGWWDRDEAAGQIRNVVRDYWVAQSAHAGVLWVFQTRLDEALAGASLQADFLSEASKAVASGASIVSLTRDNPQQNARGAVFNGELHQCRCFLVVVEALFDGEGVPRERKPRLRQDAFDLGFPDHVFVTWVGNRCLYGFPCHKGFAHEGDTKPVTELLGIGERFPDLFA